MRRGTCIHGWLRFLLSSAILLVVSCSTKHGHKNAKGTRDDFGDGGATDGALTGESQADIASDLLCSWENEAAARALWPQAGRCPQNVRVSGRTGVERAVQKWTLALQGSVLATPVVDADGIAYPGTAEGELYAIESAIPEVRWQVSLGAALTRSAVLDGSGRLYLANERGEVFAIETDDGKIAWQSEAYGPPGASPVLSGSLVLLLTKQGELHGLQATSGKHLWTVALGANTEGEVEGKVEDKVEHDLATGLDGTLLAVAGNTLFHISLGPDASDAGAQMEQVATFKGTAVDAPVVDPQGRVHLATTEGYVQLKGRKILLQQTLPGAPTGIGLLDADAVVFTTDHGVGVLESESGEVRWFSETEAAVQRHPLVDASGRICVATAANTVCFTAAGETDDRAAREEDAPCAADPQADGVVPLGRRTLLVATADGIAGCGDCASDRDCPGLFGCREDGLCYPAFCEDPAAERFACGMPGDPCGETCPDCPPSEPNCAPTRCDPNTARCGLGEAGCRSNHDCGAGLVCGVGNGDVFGFDTQERACWAPACEYFTVDPDDCGFLSDPCGRCAACDPVANCAGKECGSDGCGGSCGEPGPGQFCNGSGRLQDEPYAFLRRDASEKERATESTTPYLSLVTLPSEYLRESWDTETTGVGTLPGELQVNLSGQAEYTVPIAVPPGRAGIEPDLELVYRSSGSNDYAGLGFAVRGLSAISLCPKDVARDGEVAPLLAPDPADRRFCLDGMRLVREDPSAAYGGDGVHYRTEVDSFTRVTSHGAGPEYFEARTRDGKILTFAQRVEAGYGPDEDTPRPTMTWALTRIEDHIGNFMSVEYVYRTRTASGGFSREFYPLVMRYTGFGDQEGLAEVRFEYEVEPRPDVLVGYVGGTPILKTRRMSAIRSSFGSATERLYRIHYRELDPQDQKDQGPSLVESIEECAPLGPSDRRELRCKPPTQFNYVLPSRGFANETTIAGYPSGTSERRWHTALDLDGNGRDDLLVRSEDTWRVSLNSERFFEVPHNGRSAGVFALDYDRDGREDLFEVPFEANAPLKLLRWNEGDRAFSEQTLSVVPPALSRFQKTPEDRVLDDVQRGVYVLDLDGDGILDIVTCNPFGDKEWNAWFGQLEGEFSAPQPASLTAPCSWGMAFDLDGNASQELLVGDKNEDTLLQAVYWDGESLAEVETTVPVNTPIVPVDFNGDGLVDLVSFWTVGNTMRLELHANTGYGVVPRYDAPEVESFALAAGASEIAELNPHAAGRVVPDYTYIRRMVPYDVNHDGLMDLMTWQNVTDANRNLRPIVLRSTGTGFEVEDGFLPATETYEHRAEHVVYDADGDGALDIGYVADPEDPEFRLHVNAGPPLPKLSSIVDGNSAKTVIEYTSTQDSAVYTHTEQVCAYPMVCDWPRGNVVQRVRRENVGHDGADHVLEYSYGAGARALAGLGSLGFDVFVKRDAVRNTVETASMKRRGYRDPVTGTYPYVNVPTEVVTTSPTEAGEERRSTVISSYAGTDAEVGNCTEDWANRRAFPPNLCMESLQTTEGDELIESTTTWHNYDRFGSLSNTSSLGGYFAGTLERREETRSYMHSADPRYLDAWLLELPERVVETSRPQGLPEATRIQEYRYEEGQSSTDCDPGPQPTFGEVTGLLRRLVTGPDVPNVEHARILCRDRYGNVIREVERGEVATGKAQRRTVDLAYASDHLYPAEIRDAQGFTTQVAYDPGSGKLGASLRPLDFDDGRWLAEQFTYDGFGRPISVVHADFSVDRTAYNGTRGLEIRYSGEGIADQSVQLDPWGQAVSGTQRAFAGADTDDADDPARQFLRWKRQYDAAGRLTLQTRPVKQGGPEIRTRYRYDAQDRLIKLTPEAEEETREACDYHRVRCERDPLGYVQCQRRDLLGRIDFVAEPTETAELGCLDRAREVASAANDALPGTHFEYGAFGQLLTTTTAVGTRRTLFDDYGRPAIVEDPDRGVHAYVYNAFGELAQHLDPLGQVHLLEYDALGRTTRRQDGTPAEPLTETTIEYDEGGFYGEASATHTPEGVSRHYSYDRFGRLQREQLETPSWSRALTMAYDGRSRLQQLRYPAGTAADEPYLVEYAYDDASGVLEQVRKPGGPTFYRRLADDPFGQPTREQLGELTRATGYDELTGRLKTLALDGLLDHRYGYYPDGTLRFDDNRIPDATARYQQYQYDAHKRLIATQTFATQSNADTGESPLAEETYRFDTSGLLRRSSRLDQGMVTDDVAYTYQPGTHRVIAVEPAQSAQAQVYRYLDNGVVSGRGADASGQSNLIFSYAAHAGELPTQITVDSSDRIVNYTYDAAGERVAKTSLDGTRTHYFGEALYETEGEAGSASQHLLISAAGQVVAEVVRRPGTEDQVLHHVRDRLGSSEVLVGSEGSVVERRTYDAWGKTTQRSPSANNSLSLLNYTNHTLDPETGLIDMGARLYDPRLRRVLSPDPLIPDLYEPLDQDPYAYVRNNPLLYTDPEGREAATATVLFSTSAAVAQESAAASLLAAAAPWLVGGAIGVASGALALGLWYGLAPSSFMKVMDALGIVKVATPPPPDIFTVNGRKEPNKGGRLSPSSGRNETPLDSEPTYQGDDRYAGGAMDEKREQDVAPPSEGDWVTPTVAALPLTARYKGVNLPGGKAVKTASNAWQRFRQWFAASRASRGGRNLHAEAEAARDALAADLAKGKHPPATVVGGYSPSSGKVTAGASRGGGRGCAEGVCAEALGNPPDIQFTTATRPRTGQPVPVCTNCESTFGRGAFPDPATKYQSGP